VPELPSIEIYIERLAAKVQDSPLERVRLLSPFVLRTAVPPISEAEGKLVRAMRRIGKRIVFGLEDELFLVIHLMIAGRLRWRDRGRPIPKGNGIAALDFPAGTVLFTEASKKKRASIHLVRGEAALAGLDPGGIEVFECTAAEFRAAMRRENHTLKRALTDPHILSGIGNAYSDEILHRARMSPFRQTQSLSDDELDALLEVVRVSMKEWIDLLRKEVGDGFPEKVTAFHDAMSVHGKFGKPCPVCGTTIQRIRYADNEANYCTVCQTGGRLLADRSLSRLLKSNWPKTLEELEERRRR
jgi:formamidopyrimidine-DNA glycosylase